MAKAKKVKPEASTEAKVSNKGKKQFTLSGKAEKVRTFFSKIYTNTPKENLDYRGKKEDLTAKKQVKKKNEDGTYTTSQKTLSGTEAKQLATTRYYSAFGRRLADKQSNPNIDAMNEKAIDAIKMFLSKNTTLEAQQKNGQEILDVLMSIYTSPRVAGERKAREVKVKSAVSFDELGF